MSREQAEVRADEAIKAMRPRLGLVMTVAVLWLVFCFNYRQRVAQLPPLEDHQPRDDG
jgi:hypothetical protein